MDILFEFLFELVFEGMMETAKSKKVPMVIRIIAGVLVSAFLLAVIGVIVLVGILSFKDNKPFSVIMFILAIIFTIALILKIVKYIKKKGQLNEYKN